ncbi:hypothetical protein [Microbispora triticiradicis]|uniref:hypothetical protein n=1 Tax=Microbispora triticiradicis TaxID=2200763 RepID=UPI001AD697AE|nr:hypothetical protein [Microbispora triticiradicis]MBO4274149.1 hypothetical protein [Microbispora triticiradicis]
MIVIPAALSESPGCPVHRPIAVPDPVRSASRSPPAAVRLARLAVVPPVLPARSSASQAPGRLGNSVYTRV